jgi:hypothetical protein
LHGFFEPERADPFSVFLSHNLKIGLIFFHYFLGFDPTRPSLLKECQKVILKFKVALEK